MAEWSYPPGDPATAKAYSQFVFTQGLQACIAYKLAFVGPKRDSPDNIVQFLDELQQGPGRDVTVDLIANMIGEGTTGDNEAGPNAEALRTFQDNLKIDQLRHVAEPSGAMSQQSVHWSMREQAKSKLADWWRQRWDTILCNHVTGNAAEIRPARIGANTIVLPDVDHCLFANGKDTETVTAGVSANKGTTSAPLISGDVFTWDLITRAVTKMDTLATPIKPLRLKGMEIRGVALLHPLQVRSMRLNFTDGQWGQIQANAMQGGEITKNPIFTGALGFNDGVVIHQVPRIPYGTAAQALDANGEPRYNPLGITSTARGVILGAQALVFAWGRAYGSDMRLKWVEEAWDGFNKIRIYAGSIFGAKKLRFRNMDYATITLSSFEVE
jgi:N4-gp56 family major capsid protein